jgi:hypothetical protein
MMVIFGIVTEHMSAEDRFSFECSIDPELARQARIHQALSDPDTDVRFV